MPGKRETRGTRAALRQRAERGLEGRPPPERAPLTAEAATRVIHELEVHQVELELQAQELREAQEELLASRALYFSLYDLAPVAYLTLDEKGFVVRANLAATALLGEGPAAVQGRHFSRWVVAEDQDLLHLKSRQLLRSGSAQGWEMRLKKRDGTPLWARLDATRAEGARGAWAIRVVATDVSERRREEAARRASDAKFEATFRASHEAIAISELESRCIVEVNQAFCALTGFSRQELLGRRGTDIGLLEAGALAPDLAQLRAELHLQGVDFDVRSRSGERRTTVASFDLIELDGVPHVVSTLRDVTRELELRRQLAEARKPASVGPAS